LFAGQVLEVAPQRAGISEEERRWAVVELAVLKTALDSLKGAKRPEPEVQVVTSEERRRLLALPHRQFVFTFPKLEAFYRIMANLKQAYPLLC
jgi:hypothetical protein